MIKPILGHLVQYNKIGLTNHLSEIVTVVIHKISQWFCIVYGLLLCTMYDYSNTGI